MWCGLLEEQWEGEAQPPPRSVATTSPRTTGITESLAVPTPSPHIASSRRGCASELVIGRRHTALLRALADSLLGVGQEQGVDPCVCYVVGVVVGISQGLGTRANRL